MCYSVLQCVAVCCSVLQYVAADDDVGGRLSAAHPLHYSHILFCVAVCCSVLQCVAVCCSVLQCVAVHIDIFHSCIFSILHSCLS